jgi:hypothetical protein
MNASNGRRSELTAILRNESRVAYAPPVIVEALFVMAVSSRKSRRAVPVVKLDDQCL